MKYLNQFQTFDWERFAAGKVFRVLGQSEYVDYDSKQHLGTKIETVIYKDETEYKHKEGETGSNMFEKLTFKVVRDINVSEGDAVIPIDPQVTIYGEYRNQLSVKCADLKVMKPRSSAGQASA